MTKRSRVALILAGTLMLSAAPAAWGQAPSEPVVVSGPGGTFYGYLTPVMVVEKGGSLTYTNLDIVQHDVVQDVEADGVAGKKKNKWCGNFPRGECPIFWSKRAGLSTTVPVKGLGGVKPGEIYSFYCTLHPGMKGTLAVSP